MILSCLWADSQRGTAELSVTHRQLTIVSCLTFVLGQDLEYSHYSSWFILNTYRMCCHIISYCTSETMWNNIIYYNYELCRWLCLDSVIVSKNECLSLPVCLYWQLYPSLKIFKDYYFQLLYSVNTSVVVRKIHHDRYVIIMDVSFLFTFLCQGWKCVLG